jgi:spermidine/putrescine-binding protein
MVRMNKAKRRRIGLGLAGLALLAGCGKALKHDPAEREFNAWANQIEQSNQANGAVDFEEPSNILARVVPDNAQ